MFGLKPKVTPCPKPQDEAAVFVADLDKIVAETAAFRLHGVTRYIRPISAERFFLYAIALGELTALRTKNLADQKEFITRFFEVVRNVVDPIELEDLEKCSLQQLAALYSTIMDCVTGKEEKVVVDQDEAGNAGQDEKKKTLVRAS